MPRRARRRREGRAGQRRLRADRRARPDARGVRARDLPQPVRDHIEQQLSGQSQAALEQRASRRGPGGRAGAQGRSLEAQQADAARARRRAGAGAVPAAAPQPRGEDGQTGPPRIDDPKFVGSIVFDTRFAGGVPKAKFGDFFPKLRGGADLGPPAARPQRGRARRGDRPLPRGGGNEGVPAQGGRGRRRATWSAACRSSSRGWPTSSRARSSSSSGPRCVVWR